jgi:hypothetical protein
MHRPTLSHVSRTSAPHLRAKEDALESTALKYASPDPLEGMAADVLGNGRFLGQLLSGFCEQERDSIELFEHVASMTRIEGWRNRFRIFAREAEGNVHLYQELIRALGGDPTFVTTQARTNEFRNFRLLESMFAAGSLDGVTLELLALEAVLASQRRCVDNWRFLSELASRLPDSVTKELLEGMAFAALPVVEAQVAWTTSTWQSALVTHVMHN